MRQTELIIILSEPSTFDSFGPVGSLYMTFLVKRTGDVCKPNRVVRFTLRDKIQQWDVIERHLLSTITRMRRKHLILAVVYDRFLFHAKASHLNWPVTSRPVAMLHVGLYRSTNASIFHSSSMNGSAASPYSKLHHLGIYSHLRAWQL